ncbi:hypothetical protein F9C07_2328 [Aspergillus flavus]|uniref:Uncharacterized protein n=1 Tax=Aspergillus flavus (strain ATCC 200026 / FGSC A1120 / IAM 13836 / NRRL 3357 / JCM 12722 / SRRC 167) TaxID=332952 RepID=A0A7U2MFC9_ASPFN|nr:hypothetical protein F9C07_2328 [Aspergillus flavus]
MSLSQLPHPVAEGKESENVIIIPIGECISDGDKYTWPTEARFGMPDDSSYREKLAMLWMQKLGAFEEAVMIVSVLLHQSFPTTIFPSINASPP